MDRKYWQKALTEIVESWLKKREKAGGKRNHPAGTLVFEILEAFEEAKKLRMRRKS